MGTTLRLVHVQSFNSSQSSHAQKTALQYKSVGFSTAHRNIVVFGMGPPFGEFLTGLKFGTLVIDR
jgi:hypothetical protein